MKRWLSILFVLSMFTLPGMAKDKNKTVTPSVSASATIGPDYKIGVSDVLAINVWKEPDISRSLSVRPDGFITLPLIGDIKAAGKTPNGLRDALVIALRKYIDSPQVTVIVTEARSQRFNVLGQVTRPGAYALNNGTGVLDALAIAGGLREFAKKNKIYVLRVVNGERMRIPYNYKAVLSGKSDSSELLLQAGDTVVVP
ncbi:MAG TPA: polysaccharide biosynthesis/export family protein [Acidobacteriaceae bacterium]|jgi:polysaccharide export outer membrane protein|nr:polysaccharide biosynthesis/export family protein [Acidobacteriaceae bacterium]